MRTNISFNQRSQHGDYPYKTKHKIWQKKPNTLANLLNTLSLTQRGPEFCLEYEVKALLQVNFDDNPLKYWDKDKSYADIQLKEAHSIVRVKPMRYSQTDEQFSCRNSKISS